MSIHENDEYPVVGSMEYECKCGEVVFLEDLGDSPSYLSGKCEKCGKEYATVDPFGTVEEI